MDNLIYRDCIKKLNSSHLKTIAEAHGLVLIPFSSKTALNELSERFDDEGFIRNILEGLTDLQCGALFFITLFYQRMTATETNEFIRHYFKNDVESDQALTVLLDFGLVFHVHIPESDTSYYLIPSDSFSIVEKFCLSQTHRFIPGPVQDSGRTYRSDTPICIALFALLNYALNNDLKVNIDNSLNKRTITRIRPYLGSEFASLKYSVVEAYINDLFSYACTTGLLVLNGEQYRLNAFAMREWLKDVTSVYSSFCQMTVFVRDADNQEFWPECAVLLSMLDTDALYSLDMLHRMIAAFFPNYCVNEAKFHADPLQVYPIFILFQLGILQFITSDAHAISSWKVTQPGMTLLSGQQIHDEKKTYDNGLVIQPNYDVIVSQNADPVILWQLFQMAELVQSEFLLRFHISRDSVYSGLSKKMQPDTIIRLLTEHSKQEIPQNVIYSLSEWCEEYGSIYFMDVFLLRCKNKNIADHIKVHPKTKAYVVGDFSETDLIVRKEEYHIVLNILKEVGFMPLDTVKDPYQSGDIETKLNINGKDLLSRKPSKLTKDINTHKFRFLPGLIQR